jgi:glycosyltransferase involved in cell wall biosynthesis
MGHTTEVYGPVQALINFSEKNTLTFTSILHPLPQSAVVDSEYRVFLSGKYVKTESKKALGTMEALSYFQHIILNLFLVCKNKNRYDLCIGIDAVNAVSGLILRKLGLVDYVAFYVIDFTPKRFEGFILNSFYHFMDRYCVRHVNSVWNISNRIAKIRGIQGVEKGKNLVVPVGVELEKISSIPNRVVNRKTLVIVSHLTKSKGIDLVIEAMADVIKNVPDAKLEIIGTGPYEDALKVLVKNANLSKCVTFLGLMDHKRLMAYLPTRGIALATYLNDPNSITYFADPTKPKEYLACGLPVIITNVPWIAKVIGEKPMGIAITYKKDELVAAIIKLLTSDLFFEKCKENARQFASDLSWDDIYKRAFLNS